MFGWMALTYFVLFPAPHRLEPGRAVFWLMMQVAMLVGCVTAMPANAWLIRKDGKRRCRWWIPGRCGWRCGRIKAERSSGQREGTKGMTLVMAVISGG